MFQERPLTGKGEKNVSCEKYKECLDITANKNWKTFNCEGCGYFKTGQKEGQQAQKVDDKMLCEKCGERPSMGKFSIYCSPCLNSFKTAKKKGPKGSKKKKVTNDKAKSQKPKKTAATAITIDFGKYVSILHKIEKIADEEMRPVNMQIVYMLKKHLVNSEGR